MKEYARDLRRKGTDAERKLWRRLRHRQLLGCKFRRQEVIGPYIVDFICLEAGLIIEVDGGQHMDRQERDSRRSEYLRAHGYRVLRFWNNEVLADIDSVLQGVHAALIESRGPGLRFRGDGRECILG